MLHSTVTQSGPTQHFVWAYLFGNVQFPETCGAQERTLTSKSSTGHHSGRSAPVTAVRAMPGTPKKARPPPEARRKSRRNDAALRIAPAFVGREDLPPIDLRRGHSPSNKEKRISLRAKSGAARLPLLSETSRLVHHSPAVQLARQYLDRAGILRASGLAPCPETQAAVCRRAAALAPPNTNNARLSSRRQFRMTFRKGGKIDCCDGTHPRRG